MGLNVTAELEWEAAACSVGATREIKPIEMTTEIGNPEASCSCVQINTRPVVYAELAAPLLPAAMQQSVLSRDQGRRAETPSPQKKPSDRRKSPVESDGAQPLVSWRGDGDVRVSTTENSGSSKAQPPDWQALLDTERMRTDELERILHFERARCARLEAAIEADAAVTAHGVDRLRVARQKAEGELEREARRSELLCSLIHELTLLGASATEVQAATSCAWNRGLSAACADQPEPARGAHAQSQLPAQATHGTQGTLGTLVSAIGAVPIASACGESDGVSVATVDMGRMDMSSRVAVMLSEQLGTLSEQLHALQAEVELRMLQTARAVLQHNALL